MCRIGIAKLGSDQIQKLDSGLMIWIQPIFMSLRQERISLESGCTESPVFTSSYSSSPQLARGFPNRYSQSKESSTLLRTRLDRDLAADFNTVISSTRAGLVTFDQLLTVTGLRVWEGSAGQANFCGSYVASWVSVGSDIFNACNNGSLSQGSTYTTMEFLKYWLQTLNKTEWQLWSRVLVFWQTVLKTGMSRVTPLIWLWSRRLQASMEGAFSISLTYQQSLVAW